MKLAFKIVLIAFLSFWAEQIFPWWSVVVCAAVVSALIPSEGSKAFWAGFAAVGLLWLAIAVLFSAQTDFVLTKRVAMMFGVKASAIIILLTALIGALAGGMGALSGNLLRQHLKYKNPYRSRHSGY